MPAPDRKTTFLAVLRTSRNLVISVDADRNAIKYRFEDDNDSNGNFLLMKDDIVISRRSCKFGFCLITWKSRKNHETKQKSADQIKQIYDIDNDIPTNFEVTGNLH